ncbi:MAG: carboxypeptidase regulatory-like domain-containing protein [Roseiarcus sp.]|jgi:nickel transport protein
MIERVWPWLIVAAIAWLASSAPAEAHKLKAFATVEGTTISGYAYFTPGGRAQQADVTITGPGGVEVLKTGVDTQGNFHFVAKQRVDYTITVDGGDAHIANYVIHAADLPETLPAPEGGKLLPLDAPVPTAADAPPAAAETPADAAPSAASPAVDPAELRAMIQQSVAHEVNPLREQLDAFQEQVTWHDVLGGIGYIFGLCGVAYGFANGRRGAGRAKALARKTGQSTAWAP